MIKLVGILRSILKEEEEAPEVKKPKEEHPIDIILRDYKKLRNNLVELMGAGFRDDIDGIFITAGKPTTFKIHLKNRQYFFMMFSGAPHKTEDVYEAIVLGKRYLLTNEGNIQRATMAINRILRYGPSLEKKGPEEEEGTGTSKSKPSEVPSEKPAKVPEGPLGKIEEPT